MPNIDKPLQIKTKKLLTTRGESKPFRSYGVIGVKIKYRQMRNLMTGIILLTVLAATAQTKNLHHFKVTAIDGTEFDMASLKGKKVMIVNTASKCGNTPQYKTLQELYETYGSDKFVIVGFPANNFMNQEPGSNEDIQTFCSSSFGVTFPMMSKISVKGSDIHPLYKWLTTKTENGKSDNNVTWNFQKFLIDENGQLVESISPATKPDDKKILDWLAGK
jgi:glutathione peroxidase